MADNRMKERMRRAYAVTGELLRERLRRERPEEESELAAVEPAEVIAVRGAYDNIHRVLEATGVPFLNLEPHQLAGADWDRLQVLLINCPGQLPTEALERIAPWVRRGGYLVTTDWALEHVLEPAFPGTVRHNGRTTGDCVVRVRLEAGEADPLLQGFLEDGRDPLWWLEGSSYPIEILDRERVRVLVSSREVAEQWGEEPVVVTFEEGEGTVLHLMSHLYLQRSETRDARDAMSAGAYLQDELQLSSAEAADYVRSAEGLSSSELSAALGKARIMSKVVLESRRKAKQRKKGRAS